jgi:hypothetical protein
MSVHSSRLRRLASSQAGFTIIEMLVATIIMMAVTGAVFDVMNPSQGLFQAQPEMSDMQQRLRVGVDSIQKDLVMAGAGTYVGSSAGALNNYFAPIMPYRSDDAQKGVFFRDDAINVLYVPPTPSQTTISSSMPAQSSEIKVNPQANCPGNKQNQLCGFEVDMRLVVFDPNGNWDVFTVTQVQDSAAHLQHRDQDFTVSYPTGSWVTQVKTAGYYLKTDLATKTYQLMYDDGWETELPVVDNVVALKFEYYGDPNPPTLLPNVCLTAECKGPFTTYGPKPPPLGIQSTTTWPKGENCAFKVENNAHVPRLDTLGAGGLGQVPLPKAVLTDGPWCPDESKPNRYDADLLRIRRVRVSIRVQVASETLRGPAGLLFMRAGTSTGGNRLIPDQEVKFDVAPRNLNLGR